MKDLCFRLHLKKGEYPIDMDCIHTKEDIDIEPVGVNCEPLCYSMSLRPLDERRFSDVI